MPGIEGEEGKQTPKSLSGSIEQLVERYKGKSQTELLEIIVWQNKVQGAISLLQFRVIATLAVIGGFVAVIGIMMAAVLWAINRLSSGWYRSLLVTVALMLGVLLYKMIGHYRDILVDTYTMLAVLWSSDTLTKEAMEKLLEFPEALREKDWLHRLLRILRR